jgi:glycosyltransferase involved in cell wall biosynthesis
MIRQPETTPLAARRPTPAPLPTPAGRTRTATGQLPGRNRSLVIVPVFNERGSVSKVVRRLRLALPEFDVLVIDDGSTDDTLRRVPAGVTVVSLPFNLGIGGAMQTGYKYAALHGYDVAVQVDGDGQHRPSEVRRLVACVMAGDADLAVGSRFLEPARYRQTLARRVGAYLLGLLIQLITGLRVTDCTSGFRAANRRVIRAFAHWYPEDYPEPEVILLLHRAGYSIGELSVRMRHRRSGQSSIGLLGGLFYVLKVTTCLLLDTVRAPWPHEKFGHPATPADGGVAGSKSSNSHAHDDQEPDPAGPWREPVHTGRPASPPI